MGNAFSAIKDGSWLTAERLKTYPLIILAISVLATLFVLITNSGLLPNGLPFGTDFISFWIAARQALAGLAEVPYNAVLFDEAQKQLFPQAGFFAFFYPPHFLAYVMPLGLLGYYPALAVWMSASFAALAAIICKITQKPTITLFLLAAFPATFLTLAHGQNAFLSAALFGAGLYFLKNNQILAGIMFGLLTFKPQLGILIPLALLAGGYWTTVFSAAATLGVLIAISSALFGVDIWPIFLAQSELAMQTMRNGIVAWEKMISIYAALRVAGVPDAIASIAHWLVAVLAAGSVIWCWRPPNQTDFALKAALLVAAAVLVTPFILNYDFLIIAVSVAFFARHIAKHGAQPFEVSAIALVFMAPIFALLFMPLGISVIPLFALVWWLVVLRRCVWARRSSSIYKLSTSKV